MASKIKNKKKKILIPLYNELVKLAREARVDGCSDATTPSIDADMSDEDLNKYKTKRIKANIKKLTEAIDQHNEKNKNQELDSLKIQLVEVISKLDKIDDKDKNDKDQKNYHAVEKIEAEIKAKAVRKRITHQLAEIKIQYHSFTEFHESNSYKEIIKLLEDENAQENPDISQTNKVKILLRLSHEKFKLEKARDNLKGKDELTQEYHALIHALEIKAGEIGTKINEIKEKRADRLPEYTTIYEAIGLSISQNPFSPTNALGFTFEERVNAHNIKAATATITTHTKTTHRTTDTSNMDELDKLISSFTPTTKKLAVSGALTWDQLADIATNTEWEDNPSLASLGALLIEIPDFNPPNSELQARIQAFKEACVSIPPTMKTNEDKAKVESAKAAYNALYAVIPEDHKSKFPTELGGKTASPTLLRESAHKSTSTEEEKSKPNVTSEQRKWLEQFKAAADSLEIIPSAIQLDFQFRPSTPCEQAFTGPLQGLAQKAQNFYEACMKIPNDENAPLYETKLADAKNAYDELYQALPDTLKSEFKFRANFNLEAPAASPAPPPQPESSAPSSAPATTLNLAAAPDARPTSSGPSSVPAPLPQTPSPSPRVAAAASPANKLRQPQQVIMGPKPLNLSDDYYQPLKNLIDAIHEMDSNKSLSVIKALLNDKNFASDHEIRDKLYTALTTLESGNDKTTVLNDLSSYLKDLQISYQLKVRPEPEAVASAPAGVETGPNTLIEQCEILEDHYSTIVEILEKIQTRMDDLKRKLEALPEDDKRLPLQEQYQQIMNNIDSINKSLEKYPSTDLETIPKILAQLEEFTKITERLNVINSDLSEFSKNIDSMQAASVERTRVVVEECIAKIMTVAADEPQLEILTDPTKPADERNEALKTLLEDELFTKLTNMDSTGHGKTRIFEAATLVMQNKKDVINDLQAIINAIKDISIENQDRLNDLLALFEAGKTLNDNSCKSALANLLRVNPGDPDDLRIQILIDAKIDITQLKNKAKEKHKEIVLHAAREKMKSTPDDIMPAASTPLERHGKSIEYTNKVYAFYLENTESNLAVLIGDNLASHLIQAEIPLTELRKEAKQELVDYVPGQALFNLDKTPPHSAEDLDAFINAINAPPPRSFDQNKAIDQVIGNSNDLTRKQLEALGYDYAPILKKGKEKLATVAVDLAINKITHSGCDISKLRELIAKTSIAGTSINDDAVKNALKDIISDVTTFKHLMAAGDAVNDAHLKKFISTAQNNIAQRALNHLLTVLIPSLSDEQSLLQFINKCALPSAKIEEHIRKMLADNKIDQTVTNQILTDIQGKKPPFTLAEFAPLTQAAKDKVDLIRKTNKQKTIEDAEKRILKEIESKIQPSSIPTLHNLISIASFDITKKDHQQALRNLGCNDADIILLAEAKVDPANILDIAQKKLDFSLEIDVFLKILHFDGDPSILLQWHQAGTNESRVKKLQQAGIVSPELAYALLHPHSENVDLWNPISTETSKWLANYAVNQAIMKIHAESEITNLDIKDATEFTKINLDPIVIEILTKFSHDGKRINDALESRRAFLLRLQDPAVSDTLHALQFFIQHQANAESLGRLKADLKSENYNLCKENLKTRLSINADNLSDDDFKNLIQLITAREEELKQEDRQLGLTATLIDETTAKLDAALKEENAADRAYSKASRIHSELARANPSDPTPPDKAKTVRDMHAAFTEKQKATQEARQSRTAAIEQQEKLIQSIDKKHRDAHEVELKRLHTKVETAEAAVKARKDLITKEANTKTKLPEADAKQKAAEAKFNEALTTAKNGDPKPAAGETDDAYISRHPNKDQLTRLKTDAESAKTAHSTLVAAHAAAGNELTIARSTKPDKELHDTLIHAQTAEKNHKSKFPAARAEAAPPTPIADEAAINANVKKNKDERVAEVKEEHKVAREHEAKLLKRKDELRQILADNPDSQLKIAADGELKQINAALNATRNHISTCTMLADTTQNKAEAERKQAEIKTQAAKIAADEALGMQQRAQAKTDQIQAHIENVIQALHDKPNLLETRQSLATSLTHQLAVTQLTGHNAAAADTHAKRLDECNKLNRQIEIILKYLEKQKKQAILNKQNTSKIDNEIKIATNIKTMLEKAVSEHAPLLKQVGSFCRNHQFGPIDQTTQIVNHLLNTPHPKPNGTLGSSPTIVATKTFEKEARVSIMDINDGRSSRPSKNKDFRAAVVQKYTDAGLVTEFHCKEEDKKRITGVSSLTTGAKLIEEHRIANNNSSDTIDICGNFPKQMVKDMILYCEAKGYSYNNLTKHDYKPSQKEIAALKEKLKSDSIKTAIFGNAKGLGTSEEEVKKMKEKVELDQTPIAPPEERATHTGTPRSPTVR